MHTHKTRLIAAAFILTSLGLAGCAHHRDVRPGAGGVHRVVVRAAEESESARSAISQASHYCEELKRHAMVVSENTKYTGAMDENTRKTLRQASQAAGILGTAMGGGLTNEGRTVHTAGAVGHTMTGGEDYVTEMTFKCE